MKHLTSQQIRETWLNFFKERGHMIEPGASLIPLNDPTLLWINAGVSALKKYFDGSEIPSSKRITNVQKCIRTNDISNVGKTARHHTFFEMLGNFSIGDYFRKEVISWAFEILTSDKYFGLDKNKLYITYHPSDLETLSLWTKEGMDPSHLIPLEGNYWQIGEGPCGPNTEVFYDRGEKYDTENIGIKLLEDDIENDRYIEIWGIVFSQYNAQNGVKRENYKELPHKNIDTGAGLERICCVLQETETNFETDLFMPIIKKVEEMSGVKYQNPNLMSFRVIADHIRACTFALSDGAVFSNEGRGYVLRRLLRRAMRYGQKLGFNEPFLYKLVSTVVEIMRDFYPYLEEKQEYVSKIIKIEEEKFLKTLTSGENKLNDMLKNKNSLSGEDAFKLYDTFGFPIELTEEICSDKGVSVDLDTFNKCLERQKELARSSRKIQESFAKQSKDLLDFVENSEYLYEQTTLKTKVIACFKDGVKVESIEDEGDVILEKTCFYAEMGGEVSDTGIIENSDTLALVKNVGKAPNKQHLHHIEMRYGSLKVGDEITATLDNLKHHNIMKNHSATHLLQAALIQVLGDSIHQKGSYCCEDYLRFDFSYHTKVSENDLLKVEKIVNSLIERSIDRITEVLPIDEAQKKGAISEFGEKYGSTVRVVSFGNESIEFCGGCHVHNTSEIGLFVIKSEESISSGVRRIEALTSYKAYEYLKTRDLILTSTKKILNIPTINDTETKVNELLELNSSLNKKIDDFNKKACRTQANLLKSDYEMHGNIKVIIKYLPSFNKPLLMNIFDELKVNNSSYVFVLVGKDGEKYPLIVGVSKDLTNEFKAGLIVKKITSLVGGSGGGREELAQGAILNIEKFSEITFERIK